MKSILSIAVTVSVLLSGAAFAKTPQKLDQLILRPVGQVQLTQAQLLDELAQNDIVLMGERHYSPAVHTAQGVIINGVTQLRKAQGKFTTAWEFLNFTDQVMIKKLFEKFVKGEVTAEKFLEMTQGSAESAVYSPILESTKANQGEFIGVNLSRSDKAPVVKGGIKAADPKLVPPGFEMGGAGYYERFAGVGHFPPGKLENYFAAQCLTDDVIAYHLLNDTQSSLKFLVVGSFHTDYNDGTVTRVKARAGKQRIATVKILDASDYENADQVMSELNDPKYGPIADYVFIVNEPTPPTSAMSTFGSMDLNPEPSKTVPLWKKKALFLLTN